MNTDKYPGEEEERANYHCMDYDKWEFTSVIFFEVIVTFANVIQIFLAYYKSLNIHIDFKTGILELVDKGKKKVSKRNDSGLTSDGDQDEFKTKI